MGGLAEGARGLALALGLLALAACNFQNAPGLASDKDQAARSVYAQMRDGDMAALGPRLGEEMRGPEAEAALPQIRALIPEGEPSQVRLLKWNSHWDLLGGTRTENLETVHEYVYPDRIVTATTIMARDGAGASEAAGWRVRGFHVKLRDPNAPAPPDAADAAPSPAPSAPATAAEQGEHQTST